jgi:hypothetical protein
MSEQRLDYFILPRHKSRQLRAAATRRGCKPERLIKEALDKFGSDSAFALRVETAAKTIFNALNKGSYRPSLWPRSVAESLAVAMLFNDLNERSAEEHLLEMSEDELTFIERLCAELGIGYDDLVGDALLDLYRKGGFRESDEEEEDPADWWKKA